MSQELAKQSGALAETGTGVNPFDVLPPDWIPPTSAFCQAKSHLLKSAAPVTYHLKLWMADGLTLDDAKVLFRRLCSPAATCRMNFDNQLIAEMAAIVVELLRRRRAHDESRQREEAERNPTGSGATIIRLADALALRTA